MLLTSAELLVKHAVTIAGPGADQLMISGSHHSRVFEVAATAKAVALGGLTVSDGFTTGNSGTTFLGGGILNESTLTLSNCALTGNSAPQRGAISNLAALTLVLLRYSWMSESCSAIGTVRSGGRGQQVLERPPHARQGQARAPFFPAGAVPAG